MEFEFVLPRLVSARYVTASMLDCENYLDEDDRNIHPHSNIDMKSIAFKGTRVRASLLL
jgi:hypothetical protein